MKTLARNRLRTTLSDSVLLLLTSTTFVILTYLLGNVAFLYPLKTLKNRKVLFSGGTEMQHREKNELINRFYL